MIFNCVFQVRLITKLNEKIMEVVLSILGNCCTDEQACIEVRISQKPKQGFLKITYFPTFNLIYIPF